VCRKAPQIFADVLLARIGGSYLVHSCNKATYCAKHTLCSCMCTQYLEIVPELQ